jgi:glycosyltransferase 2 family protein
MNATRTDAAETGASETDTAESKASDSRVKPWKWLVRFGLGLLVLGVLASQRSAGAQILATLRAVPFWVVLLAMAFYWLGQVLCAWKWQRLLQARGVHVSLPDCCRFYAAGMFGNLWLPTNVGGDALRSALLHQKAPELGLAGAAASVLVERLTGFAALLLLAAGGLLWRGFAEGLTEQTTSPPNGASGWPVILAALVIIAALVLGWQALGRVKHRKIESIRAALGFYLHPERRGALWFALWVSLVFQASQVLLNIGLAHATKLPVPDAVFWWLGPLLSLSGLIPVGVGGLGAREAAAVALLKGSAYAVSSGQLVGWSLLWQATVWVSSLPGALWVRGTGRPAKGASKTNE